MSSLGPVTYVLPIDSSLCREAVQVGVSRPVHFVVVLVSHMVRVVRLPLVYMQRVERYVLEFAVYRSSLYRGNYNEGEYVCVAVQS